MLQDNTCDMAVVARSGSLLVRKFRDLKEKKKAQHKDWELAGTKLGNILGIKKKDDKEVGILISRILKLNWLCQRRNDVVVDKKIDSAVRLLVLTPKRQITMCNH